MEQDENNLKDSFEKEIEKIKVETILSPEYRRKKTIIWGIRTVISIILFMFFWKHNWVRWLLIAYIPLNFFNLISIYKGNAILNKKIAKTQSKIDEMEEIIDGNQND
ncbi:MAG: hypothetical protein ABJL44_03285 [Algibacter sp.]